MKQSFRAGLVFTFISILVLSTIFLASPVLAEEPAATVDKLTLDTKFPILKVSSGSTFEFDIEVNYEGKEAKVFEFNAKGPQDFLMLSRAGYEGKEIVSMRLDANKSFPETVKLVAIPLPWKTPAPGEYTFTMGVSSGSLKKEISVKGIVTDRYELKVETSTGRLNLNATAGEETPLTIKLTNTGTGPLEKVTFSSDKPDEWIITFDPKDLESIPATTTREIQVKVKPASRAIAGDYMTTLRVDTKEMRAWGKLEMRVTVLTSTIWGWVGIGIVVLIIAGLAAIFWRFGRR